MPWIQHYSKFDIKNGNHFFEEGKTILIQILDEDEGQFPLPKHEFIHTAKFIFEDTEEDSPYALTDNDAEMLSKILLNAKANGWNIVVHCYAGLCRSSAVAMMAQKIGFDLDEKTRLPNKLVMSKMMKHLEFEIDDSEFIKEQCRKQYYSWLEP
jgi:predicted protein tyrosine phosphatase